MSSSGTKKYLIGHLDGKVFSFCLFLESGQDKTFKEPKGGLGGVRHGGAFLNLDSSG